MVFELCWVRPCLEQRRRTFWSYSYPGFCVGRCTSFPAPGSQHLALSPSTGLVTVLVMPLSAQSSLLLLALLDLGSQPDDDFENDSLTLSVPLLPRWFSRPCTTPLVGESLVAAPPQPPDCPVSWAVLLSYETCPESACSHLPLQMLSSAHCQCHCTQVLLSGYGLCSALACTHNPPHQRWMLLTHTLLYHCTQSH